MKVKEIAEALSQPCSEIIKLLQNVVRGKEFSEDTEIGDKALEKKLANRYGVPYPFKNKAKQQAAPAPKKPLASVKINQPKVEEQKAPKKVAKPQDSQVKTVTAKSQAQERSNTPKQQTTQSTPKQNQSGANFGNNRTATPMQNGQNANQNNNRSTNQTAQNGYGQRPQLGQNNNRTQNGNGFGNNTRPAQNGMNSRPQGNRPQYGKNSTKSGTKPIGNVQSKKIDLNATIGKGTARPSDIKSYKDEIVESRLNEEELEKYDEYLEDNQYDAQQGGGKKKVKMNDVKVKKPKQSKSRAEKLAGHLETEKEENVLYYELNMTVMDVAEALGVSVTDLVKKLFTSMGVFASATQTLDRDTIELIAMEYNFEVKNKQITDMIRFDEIEIEDKEEDLTSRPAIVTIMGHVDHGKTTLLDTIRSSHVVKGEAGGITQHIGAYQVTKSGKLITFIDTPGHAAFTEMRARGAQVTDIVILVVAADDGVMPQTKEAIEHAQAANVPIIVAVNKMDKPGASPERIKQELMTYNLIADDWGGDTFFCPISALTGKGVDDLLDIVNLLAESKNYRANPSRDAVGSVIEARLDKGRGPVATLLVQNGTLKVGDMIVVGTTYGKVRAMQDELGRIIKTAGPAKPVEITGLAEVPFAGEKFMAINDEKKAKAIAEVRAQNKFNEEMGSARAASLNEILAEQDGEVKVLNLIIKCDVQGSIEAIKGLLEKTNIEGTKINVISSRVGGVTDNDISLAIASHAIIVGFNIRPTSQISDLAKEKNVEIRLYNIIYKLQEDIEKAAKGMLDPVFEEVVTGEAEVRELFKISRIGTIAGSMVTKGEIRRGGSIRVIRDSIVVYQGKIAGLRRFKDDVKEVREGYDCGITIENYNDIKVGDRLECFVMEETERE